MASEFTADACEHLILAMREAGIGPDIAGPIAERWLASVLANWRGERPYIGGHGQAERERSRRDAAIVRDWRAGERAATLVRRYGISRTRLYEILRLSAAVP